MQQIFSKAAGRNIKVFHSRDLTKCIDERNRALGVFIPRELDANADLHDELHIPSE